jgi:hypothetical protein
MRIKIVLYLLFFYSYLLLGQVYVYKWHESSGNPARKYGGNYLFDLLIFKFL